jgi:hypothetical protein
MTDGDERSLVQHQNAVGKLAHFIGAMGAQHNRFALRLQPRQR